MSNQKIMFVAAEPSGDIHAAQILERLKQLRPDIHCFGIGGPTMQQAGFEPVLPFEPFNRMGFVEVFKNLPFFLKAKKVLLQIVKERKPALVVLVDFPGFNVRLLKSLFAQKVLVLYYIAPKVWAWKRDKRAAVLERCAARIATIFPFEHEFYSPGSSKVTFVGNPLVEALDKDPPLPQRDNWAHKCKNKSISLALVPGSRKQEVSAMLPAMIDTFAALRAVLPQATAVVSHCRWLPGELFECCKNIDGLSVSSETLDSLFRRTDCALVTSGTATLEAALRGLPHIIVYKTSAVSYFLYKKMLRTPWIGLPNIVAQRTIVPERYQQQVCSTVLAADLLALVTHPSGYTTMAAELAALRAQLGSKRPSHEVTQLILNSIDSNAG